MKPGREIRPLIFGEVLFDHFPDGSSVLGGAPFNVAWHLQAFGLAPLFVSRVGTDAPGEQIRAAMQSWGMDLQGLQSDAAHATGSVEVGIAAGEPHYEIVHPCAYDFIEMDALPDLSGDYILYHGSLALRHDVSARALAELKRRASAPRFIDINLRSPWWDDEGVQQMLTGARWIKLNEDELKLIVPTGGDDQAIRGLLADPSGFIALTRGEAGASIISTEGRHDVQPSAALPVVDAVGAGDAFCSVLLAGIIRNWTVPVMLERAQQFASAIVGIRGATTRDGDFYRRVTDAWRD